MAAEEGQLAADDRSEVYGVSAEQDLSRVLQKVAHADGGDQHRQASSLAQWPVGQSLDDHAQHCAYRHGNQHRHQRRSSSGKGRGGIPQQAASGKGRNIKGYIGTHHDDVAMGEVEHFGNSVHHSIPQGNDGVDAPHADAVDQVGQKFHTRSHLSLFPVMAGTRERRCAVLTGPAAETQGGCQVSPRQPALLCIRFSPIRA